MKLLFCSHRPLKRTFGASKVLIELAGALRELGWEVDLAGPEDIAPGRDGDHAAFRPALREFLRSRAEAYDVIDYEHEDLPYPRSDFSERPLFVARSVLLTHHLDTISIPKPRSLRALAGRVLHGPARRRARANHVELATRTIMEADLVNVSNPDDKLELVRRGVPARKIIVLPYGIPEELRSLFERVPVAIPEGPPLIGFVGSFDYRKGAAEFPGLVSAVNAAIPQARFRLIGTRGLFSDAEQVLKCFPRRLRGLIEVIPQFKPEELPQLLAGCSAGVFPSYLEGFAFGVLEMSAAALPVIAYEAPGSTFMLAPERLVRRGDGSAMASKIVSLLRDPAALIAARLDARDRSRAYRWESIARQTAEAYTPLVERRSRLEPAESGAF